jgi:hypothetical protein
MTVEDVVKTGELLLVPAIGRQAVHVKLQWLNTATHGMYESSRGSEQSASIV